MLGVFAVHFGQRMSLTGTIRLLTDFGKYGVQLFFVISGFLIINSLDKCSSAKDVIIFYVKKCIRLLVLYYLVILWYFVSETFIFKTITPDPYKLGWLRYVFLLNGIVPGNQYLWTNVGITWTIPIFSMAYLVTPIFYKLMKFNTTRKLLLLFAVSFGTFVLQKNFLNGWASFLTHYYVFVGGMLVYKALQEKQEKLVTIGSLALIVALMAINTEKTLLVSLISMVLLIEMHDLEIKNTKLLSVINVVDSHSYTLYLGHGIIFCSVLDKFIFPPSVKLLIAILGSLALTIVLYNFYEKPITKFLNKKIVR